MATPLMYLRTLAGQWQPRQCILLHWWGDGNPANASSYIGGAMATPPMYARQRLSLARFIVLEAGLGHASNSHNLKQLALEGVRVHTPCSGRTDSFQPTGKLAWAYK